MARLTHLAEEWISELDWAANYCRKHQVEQYRLEVRNETGLQPPALVSSALNRLHLWYSQEACTGLDVLEFLTSGRIFAFEYDEEFLEETLLASESPGEVPVRTCRYALEERDRPLALPVLGPVQDERLLRALLQGWRRRLERDAAESDWLKVLGTLYDLALQVRDPEGGNPDGLLDRLHPQTASFGRYDGEFCAHSCGELYARPLLDCAAILAHGQVRFEQEGPGVYRAQGVPRLARRHFGEFVVPGLALLLLEHLQHPRELTRFESVRYSGDRCALASFGCDRLPGTLFGRALSFPAGSRFVLRTRQPMTVAPLQPEAIDLVIAVEPDLRLQLLERPGAAGG